MKLFGMSIYQSLLRISIIALVIGCSREPDTHNVSGDVKIRIPFAAEGGTYSLQEITLSGITSLYEFSGSYANFYIYPSVSGSKIVGYQPKTRFLKSGALYIPEDVLSQQVAVIYAHFQRLAALDVQVGAEGINKWPRDVGVAVRYKNAGKYDMNNAFYDGTTDSVLVVPYTQDHLPIAVNAGILAHEHFHSLYYKIVEKNVFKNPMPLHGQEIRAEVLGVQTKKAEPDNSDSFIEEYHKLFSRGINEGLADFWAWIYTGDPDFLQASLPSETSARSMNLSEAEVQSYKFPNTEIWKMRLINRYNDNPHDKCGHDRVAYCLGTDYARTLKRYANVVQSSRGVNSEEARKLVGASIVRALPLLRESLLALKKTEYFEPVSFFTMLEKSVDGITSQEKDFLETLVTRATTKEAAPCMASLRPSGEDAAPRATIIPSPLVPGVGAGR